MRNRSILAAWAIAAGFTFVAVASAGEGDPPAIENTVRLEVQIAGMGPLGGKIEIKPAHPGCQFKTVEKTIAKGESADLVKLDPIVMAVASTGADRDCSFEIILTEPGMKARTFRRGLQLTSPQPGAKTPVRTLKCTLPIATIATKDESTTKKRR